MFLAPTLLIFIFFRFVDFSLFRLFSVFLRRFARKEGNIFVMKFYAVFWLIVLMIRNFDSVDSLQCFLTGYPFAKNCTLLIHDRYGTSPACLSAIVLDGKKTWF
jgi:hypothetical protein